MYQKKKSSWFKHLDFMLMDLLCLEISFIIAYMIRHGFTNPYGDLLYREMAIVFGMMDLLVIFFCESFKDVLRRGYFQEFKKTLYQTMVVLFLGSIFLLLIKDSGAYSRIAFFYMGFLYFGLSYLGRIGLKRFLKRRISQNAAEGRINPNTRSMLVITSSDRAEIVVKNIQLNNFEYIHLTGVCVVDQNMQGQEILGVPVVANDENLYEYVCRNWIDEVFLNLSHDLPLSEDQMNTFIAMGITVHLRLAKIADVKGQKQSVEKLAGYTVLSSSINMASARQLFFKRVMDIAGGLVGCLITGILYIFVAPAIKIKSPGPTFFSQVRVGKNGRKFKIYKFRSMYMDAEERKAELMSQNKMDGLMFKMDNDPRIIGGEKGKGIGNFIRNTSIDEFPQFWNVLKGDMSLVGTRPPTLDEWEKYELHHRARLAIKPGLTGMWQVSGRSDITDFEEVVKLDTEYITKWNFGLDLKILVKTVLIVLNRSGAE